MSWCSAPGGRAGGRLAAAEGGASVGLFEKADRVGGTTAISVRGMLGAGNAQRPPAGWPTAGTTRCATWRRVVRRTSARIRRGFRRRGGDARVFGWLESAAALQMRIVSGYPDYHPDDPAASRRRATLET